MKYGQLVIGPAGCGKSSYCALMLQHCEVSKRSCRVVNLDPAAEYFSYTCDVDIRNLISVEDVMKELQLGPNGALLYCMDYLIDNMEWLESEMGDLPDDAIILFDCPGQLELFSHSNVMITVTQALLAWDFRLCGICCLDVSFATEASKLLAGSISALSAMIQLELPHLNVLTKCDLLHQADLSETENAALLDSLLQKEPAELLSELQSSMPAKYFAINEAFATILEDYSLVSYLPLNPNDEESIGQVMFAVDTALQFSDDMEPRAVYDIEG
ncbi:ATP-binding domain 1 family protein [Cardiosporidium cionae]|uniref:GPN-loop GTPase 3 n=1 Tax=Cardiosporidium cionae TaxID=476202 RepID=A0ABQ7J8G1_9APIC|nr:ATP-binding domain 1 family protein [Cardiosporidium cionae]|eukprot:KAF8820284.1 ATP-binding domain 1 family protein [Cardiosporidium cionae]